MSANTRLVENFIAIWEEPRGLDRAVREYFTAGTVWENVGLTNTTGIEAALEVNRMFGEKLGMHSIRVDMLTVAEAGNKVLTERILAKPDAQQQVTFNLRLAPGAMPVRVEADGAALAPVAHAFESLFSPAVTGFRPPWSVEQFYDALSSWAGVVATRGTPLDEKLPVNAWLALAAKQGHLEAFCYQLLGPAFPAEMKAFKASNGKALKAYQAFLKASPLQPQHAVMPDELVRIK